MAGNKCEQCHVNNVKGKKKMCDDCIMEINEEINSDPSDGPVLRAIQRLEAKMDRRFGDLEASLTDKFRTMVDEQIQSMKDEMNREITDLRQKVSHLEHKTAGNDSCKQTIVIKNLPMTQGENVSQKVNSLIKDGLKLRDVEVERVERKESHLEGRHGHVIAKLRSVDHVKSVMKHKAKLKDSTVHKDVYIEPDRSRQERQNISNMRTIVNAVGRDKLELKGSRLVRKQTDQEAANATRGQHRPHGAGATAPPGRNTRRTSSQNGH